jgi:hypothetical protein
MNVSLILIFLSNLDIIILCEPLASKTLFYPTSSINLRMNLHECNILFITYQKQRPLILK